MSFYNLFDHFQQKLKSPFQTSVHKIYKNLFLFSKSCLIIVTFTGTFTKYFWSGFCLCVFSSKCIRPYCDLANLIFVVFFQIYVNYLNIIVNILLPLTFLVVMNICIYRTMGNQWYRKIVLDGLAETDQNQETKSCLNHSTS